MKKSDTTLQDLLKLLGLQSDSNLRCLLESVLRDASKFNLVHAGLEKHLDLESLLSIKKDPHLIELDNLRKLRKQIEERIEALIEKIRCLLEQLRGVAKDILKRERKRLLKLILSLINLLNLKDLIEKLEAIIEKKIKK